jgi:rod shape-determining protein MreD
MKTYLVLIPVFILVVFQASILPLNLLLVLILIRTALKPDQQSFYLAFWSGLLLDLAQGTPLGLSSLIFLLAALLLFFYSKKFEPTYVPFLAVFVFLISLLYNWTVIGYFGWQKSLVLAIITFLFSFLWQKFVVKVSERKVRLRSLR